MSNDNPRAWTNPTQLRAAQAIERRRAAGHFGTTDALELIRNRYRCDLSDYINRDYADTAGVAAVVSHKAAHAAVDIAKQVLRAEHRVADLAQQRAAQSLAGDESGAGTLLSSQVTALAVQAAYGQALAAVMDVFAPEDDESSG